MFVCVNVIFDLHPRTMARISIKEVLFFTCEIPYGVPWLMFVQPVSLGFQTRYRNIRDREHVR